MKDVAYSNQILKLLQSGGGVSLASGQIYLALVKASGYDDQNRSTWVEPNNTASSTALTANGSDMTGYARKLINFGTGTPTTGTGADAGYQVLTATQVDGQTTQQEWAAFLQNITLAGGVLCTSATASLSTCGIRGCDTSLNQAYTATQKAAVTASGITVREQ
jgi:hypothetical protein